MDNNTAKSFVYAIKAIGTDFIKIGVAINPKQRIRELQTGSPHKLEIVATWEGSYEFERAMHAELAAFRTNGEWFQVQEWVVGWKAWRLAELAKPLVVAPSVKPIRSFVRRAPVAGADGYRYEIEYRERKEDAALYVAMRACDGSRFKLNIGAYSIGKLSKIQRQELKGGNVRSSTYAALTASEISGELLAHLYPNVALPAA